MKPVPVRRSSRLQEARLKVNLAKDENEPLETTSNSSSTSDGSNPSQLELPTVRAKRHKMEGLKSDDIQTIVTVTRTTGGGGKLSELPTMPLDILFEVAIFLLCSKFIEITRPI